jgi:salicylate hydroxylase
MVSANSHRFDMRTTIIAKQSVIVVGAGIGGLSAALALRQAGLDVLVLERALAFVEVGAGLTLTPPGLRALDALRLLAPTLAASDNVARTAFIDYASGELLRMTESSETADRPATTDETRVIHRSDMHAILLDAALAAGVELRSGCEMAGISQNDTQATVHLADGTSASADLVVAADGVRSVARSKLHAGDPLRNIGIVAWRALIPVEDVADVWDGQASAVHMGPGATFVRYTVRHGGLLNCVAIVKTDVIAAESWSTPSTLQELVSHFDGWSPGLHALLERMPSDGLFKWPLLDRDPIDRWTEGRITLLGDAAHPMLPFLGIGATMAIEDAVVLGRTMAAAEIPQRGLADYEQDRIERAIEITLASRRQAEIVLDQLSAENMRRELPTLSGLDYDVRQK